MIGNKYADTAFCKVKNDVLYIDHRKRINAGKRFIEQYKCRIRCKRG